MRTLYKENALFPARGTDMAQRQAGTILQHLRKLAQGLAGMRFTQAARDSLARLAIP